MSQPNLAWDLRRIHMIVTQRLEGSMANATSLRKRAFLTGS
jgi:hypothetical protein